MIASCPILLLVLAMRMTSCTELDALEQAVHGALAGDDLEYSDNKPDIFPPADSFVNAQNPQWELDPQEAALPAAEQVDEWEAIPLPIQAEQLQQDSEAVGKAGSQARLEVEELSEQIVQALDEMGRVEFVQEVNEMAETGDSEDLNGEQKKSRYTLENIFVFNTDDFDGDESDEHEDSHNYL